MKEADASVHPTVVITRPKPQADAFATALIAANGSDLPILIAPLMQIDPVKPTDLGHPAHIVFTSVNGVQQAESLGIPKDAIAWCVGDQTADAASHLGFPVRNAAGASGDLVRMMVAAQPKGNILHLRGAHATGRIVDHLTDAGLIARDAIVYAQNASVPPPELRQALDGSLPLVVPLFSPRSATLFGRTLTRSRPMTVIAMSEAVSRVAETISGADVITVNFPDKKNMIAATLQAYAALSHAKMP